MGMPYGYNNSPYGTGYGTGQQNPYAGYNMPQQPQQQAIAPQASLTPEQAQSLAQQNAQELGNNITNAALLGGVVGAGAGAMGVLNEKADNFNKQYVYEEKGVKYHATLKDKGSPNPIARRVGAKSENGEIVVDRLTSGNRTIRFSNYKGDTSTPMRAEITYDLSDSKNPIKVVLQRSKEGVLKVTEVLSPTGERMDAQRLRLDADALDDLNTRHKAATHRWHVPFFSADGKDLGKRKKYLEKSIKRQEEAKRMFGIHYNEIKALAEKGLKDSDLPDLAKVAREARIDKALDWSGMLKNIAKGSGLGLLVAGAGAGLLTLLTQQRPAYARQSNPTPNQGFRPY